MKRSFCSFFNKKQTSERNNFHKMLQRLKDEVKEVNLFKEELELVKLSKEKLMNELEFRDDLYLVEYSPDHLTVASEYLGCEDDDAEKPDPASKKQRVE